MLGRRRCSRTGVVPEGDLESETLHCFQWRRRWRRESQCSGVASSIEQLPSGPGDVRVGPVEGVQSLQLPRVAAVGFVAAVCGVATSLH